MSRVRTLVIRALVLAALGYAARFSLLIAADWMRANKIRDMSDEGPLSRELPSFAAQIILDQGSTVRELGEFALKSPGEFARYLRTEAM